jgi:hypothetical protein
VIGILHRLKQDEEGQALVLGAIFGLVLVLCVLSTVGLGRAVYDKVQLQTAADAAAYSQAAVEARVLNFTAYTNRAMVVHYASIMAASAYLTWVHFLWAGINPLLTVLTFVPAVGAIAEAINEVINVLVAILDAGVAALTPILAAANVVLWGLQEGAWAAVSLRLSTIAPEAHSGDSAKLPYQPIWPLLTSAANMGVFARTRGSAALLLDMENSAKILLNDKNRDVQLARAHMLEIANSARQPWVAYGDRWDDPSPLLFNRHASLGFHLICDVRTRNVARTELGSPPPGSTRGAAGQIFSGSALEFDLDCPWWLPSGKARIFQLATMDQVFPALSPENDYDVKGVQASGPLGPAIRLILRGTAAAMETIARDESAPEPPNRPFWISPYVSFAPQARSTPGGLIGDLGNFAQPDVVVGLAKEGIDMNREGGMDKLQARRFASSIGGSGSADLSYTNADWPSIKGISPLHKGLNAFAAAQVYYHRPGDWRETPNFFNPLWGARLMPIVESNAAAMIPGLVKTPPIPQLLLH